MKGSYPFCVIDLTYVSYLYCLMEHTCTTHTHTLKHAHVRLRVNTLTVEKVTPTFVKQRSTEDERPSTES